MKKIITKITNKNMKYKIKKFTLWIVLLSMPFSYMYIGGQIALLTQPKPNKEVIYIKHYIEPQDATESHTEHVEIVWQESARITAYSELDSCHYPDGKGGCLNSYNETIQDGQIACPRWIKKGSLVEIEGMGEFTCMDKTAKWVQENRGATFDVWFGYGESAHEKALAFGSQKRLVTLKKR